MKNHSEQTQSAPKKHNDSQLVFGMSTGICLGVSLGVALDNLGLWLPLGIALGAAMGGTSDMLCKKKDK